MSVPPPQQGEGWTFADLEDMPEDDLHRYEVVDGALLVSPAPADWHQAIARRLFRQLDRQCPPAWEVLYETAFRVGDNGRVPDLAVVTAGLPVRPREAAYQPPDFAMLIEVVSPSSRGMDRILKPAEYAAAGVPYYWRVETEPDVEVVAFSLREASYVETARAADGVVTLPGPWNASIDVTALRA